LIRIVPNVFYPGFDLIERNAQWIIDHQQRSIARYQIKDSFGPVPVYGGEQFLYPLVDGRTDFVAQFNEKRPVSHYSKDWMIV
jgi:hypothetical protein